MTDKRLALVVSTFPKLSETFIVNKFLGLWERGWDVHVVCGESDPREWEQFPDLLRLPQVRRRVHVVWQTRLRWLAAMLMPLALMVALKRSFKATWQYLRHGWPKFGWGVLRHLYFDAELVKLQPDLIHMEFGSLAMGRMHLRELLNCKLVASFRGYDLNFVGLETPDYYQEVWEKADALHFLGEDLWQRAQKRGCSPDKLRVLIPPAINLETFNPVGKVPAQTVGAASRPLRILSLGRLEWKKGYEYALQAVRVLASEGICCDYRIIGGGDYLEAVAFARHQLGLDTEVNLLGALPPSKVKEHLLWADVFLHAAVTEGFCNAVIEAQAMMLPVVCSDAGGLPENVCHGVTGFVVPRRHPKEMATMLMLLARDGELRQRMGQAGRQRVTARFRLPDQISAFEAFYHQVLRDGSNDYAG
jgi:colanic acid/amylovoran biosynthesis glycosyltransferase